MSRQLLLNGMYTKGMKFGCMENFVKAFWIKTVHVCMHAYAYGHTERYQIGRGMARNMMHMRAIYRELYYVKVPESDNNYETALLEKRVLKCHEKCLNNLSGNACTGPQNMKSP